MSLVLDASMTIAWLFTTEQAVSTEAVLRRVSLEGAVVPSLWRLEVANVLWNAIRRGRCEEKYAERCLKRLERLSIRVDSKTDKQAWGQTRQLAYEQDLTLYDAAYLELALRCQLPLASCDTALIKAAQVLGVEILDPLRKQVCARNRG